MKDRIAVIGLGYVGLPLSIAFNKKFDVVGYDLNSYKQAKNGETNPILIGRTRVNPKNPKKIELLEVGDSNF